MAKPQTTQTVTLSNAIEIDGQKVTEITLRKPKAGELRGLSMVDILRMDVSTMFRLLPRITMPPVSDIQLSSEIETDDFTAMAAKTLIFFAKPEQLQLPD